MSRFFVGQRVRIKYSNGWPELRGEEGVIIKRSAGGGLDGTSEWLVAPDCWGTYVAPDISRYGSSHFGPNSEQLEPITYDGSEPCGMSYQEMMDKLKENTSVNC